MMKIFILAITTLIFTLNCSNHNVEVTSQKKHIPKILSEGDKIIFEKYDALDDISEYVSEGYPETILIIGSGGSSCYGGLTYFLIDTVLIQQTGKRNCYGKYDNSMYDDFQETGFMTITKISTEDLNKIKKILQVARFGSFPEKVNIDEYYVTCGGGSYNRISFSDQRDSRFDNYVWTSQGDFDEWSESQRNPENSESIKKQFDTIIRFNNCYKQIEKLLEKYYESSRYFKFERYVDYILSLEKKYNKSNMNWSFPNFTHLKSAPFASNWESEYGWHGYFEDWYIKNK